MMFFGPSTNSANPCLRIAILRQLQIVPPHYSWLERGCLSPETAQLYNAKHTQVITQAQARTNALECPSVSPCHPLASVLSELQDDMKD